MLTLPRWALEAIFWGLGAWFGWHFGRLRLARELQKIIRDSKKPEV